MGGRYQEEIFYNQERKDKYLEDNPVNQRSALKRIFLASYEQEKQLGKDLCDFNREELLKLYSYINASSVSVLYNLHCLIKRYMNDVDPKNKQKHYDETEGINKEFLLRYCNKVARKFRILTREEVIDLIENPVFMNTMDQFVLLALFEGIKGHTCCEILNLRQQDIKMENGICKAQLCTGRSVEISSKLYNIAMNTIETDTYVAIRKGYIIEYPLEKTDFIFRRAESKSVDGEVKNKSVQTRLRRLLASIGLDKQVSVKSIFDSGMIDYAKSLAKENGISLSECIDNNELWEKIYTRYGYTYRKGEKMMQDLYAIRYEIQQYINE